MSETTPSVIITTSRAPLTLLPYTSGVLAPWSPSLPPKKKKIIIMIKTNKKANKQQQQQQQQQQQSKQKNMSYFITASKFSGVYLRCLFLKGIGTECNRYMSVPQTKFSSRTLQNNPNMDHVICMTSINALFRTWSVCVQITGNNYASSAKRQELREL